MGCESGRLEHSWRAKSTQKRQADTNLTVRAVSAMQYFLAIRRRLPITLYEDVLHNQGSCESCPSEKIRIGSQELSKRSLYILPIWHNILTAQIRRRTHGEHVHLVEGSLTVDIQNLSSRTELWRLYTSPLAFFQVFSRWKMLASQLLSSLRG